MLSGAIRLASRAATIALAALALGNAALAGPQPPTAASSAKPAAARPAVQSTGVLTERQKYCRAKRGCALKGPACAACRQVR